MALNRRSRGQGAQDYADRHRAVWTDSISDEEFPLFKCRAESTGSSGGCQGRADRRSPGGASWHPRVAPSRGAPSTGLGSSRRSTGSLHEPLRVAPSSADQGALVPPTESLRARRGFGARITIPRRRRVGPTSARVAGCGVHVMRPLPTESDVYRIEEEFSHV